MATKTLTAIVQHRLDTVANWETNNPVPPAGEVVVATIPAQNASDKPAVLVKIGDGVNTFTNLPYLSALAGDVFAWAKQADKPAYTADEITGLADYISGEIEDTDTQYQIVAGSTSKEFLFQSKDKTDSVWTTQYTLTIPPEITYEVSSDGDGTLTLTPSEGDAQQITVVTLDTDKSDITTGSTNVPTSGAVADYVDDKLASAVEDLDFTDTPVAGEFITEVNEADGIISVSRRKPTVSDISDLAFEGTYDKDTNKAATIADINQAIVGVHAWKGAKDTADDLPDPDDESNRIGDVWHVRDTGDEYSLTVNDDGDRYWELFGSETDLSGYYDKTETDALLDAKQDVLSADNKLPVSLITGTATDEADGLMSKEDKAKVDGLEDALAGKIEKIMAGDEEVPVENQTATLSKVAYTGNVNDIIQTEGDVLILCGGDSTGSRTASE